MLSEESEMHRKVCLGELLDLPTFNELVKGFVELYKVELYKVELYKVGINAAPIAT